MTRRHLLITAASAVSILGVAMAGASALDRGATGSDQALLVAMAAVVTLGAHLLPAVCRRPAAWGVWVGLMLAVIYGHAVFFTGAAHRAGAARSADVAPTARTALLRAELEALQARPLSVVAADQARVDAAAARAAHALAACQQQTPGRCGARVSAVQQLGATREALQTERREAERAQALREQLTAAAGALDTQRDRAQLDPVGAQAGALLGLPADTVQLIVSVGSALLLELLAALLWAEALRVPAASHRASAPAWPAEGTRTARSQQPHPELQPADAARRHASTAPHLHIVGAPTPTALRRVRAASKPRDAPEATSTTASPLTTH